MANFNWAYINVDGVTVVNALSASTSISASTFHGDGSGLTGISGSGGGGAISSYTNPGNNRVVTSVDSNTVNSEANLTFDGSKLSATGQISASLGVTGSSLHAAGTSVSDGLIEMKTGTGSPAKINLYCESSNAHKVILSAPPHSAFSGDVNFVLPPTEGTNGQVLITDGNGVTSWANSTAITGAFTANYNVLSSYDVMTVNTSGSVVTASLLAANSYSAGQRLVFKDIGGSGSTNNVVIKPSGSQTIDSGTSLKIQVNYGAVTIVSDGSSNFHIIGVN